MKKTNKTATLIKKISETMADISFGTASIWGIYQPKEPASVKKRKK